MVLSKLILEKYLNNRFNAGVAEGEAKGRQAGKEEGKEQGREEGRAMGREQADREWRAWYNRMTDARVRGDHFDEPPPASILNGERSPD